MSIGRGKKQVRRPVRRSYTSTTAFNQDWATWVALCAATNSSINDDTVQADSDWTPPGGGSLDNFGGTATESGSSYNDTGSSYSGGSYSGSSPEPSSSGSYGGDSGGGGW